MARRHVLVHIGPKGQKFSRTSPGHIVASTIGGRRINNPGSRRPEDYAGFNFKPVQQVVTRPAINSKTSGDPLDRSYKLYPITVTAPSIANGGGKRFEAQVIADLMTYASTKIDTGVQGDIKSATLLVHSASALAAYPTVLPRLHIGILESEAGGAITGTKEGVYLTEAVAAMCADDLWNYTEVGEIQLRMAHADAGDYWFIGQAEFDLTKLLRRMAQKYQEAESRDQTAELPTVNAICILEGKDDGNAYNVYAELRLMTVPGKLAFKSVVN